MSIFRFLSVSALICLMAGCTLFPKARDVTISGTFTGQDGQVIPGLRIYYVVLRFQPGMPGTGEHGFVVTDAEGRYNIQLREVFDVVSLSEDSLAYRCGGKIADIPVKQLVANQKAVHDFVCQSAAANNSFKPNQLRYLVKMCRCSTATTHRSAGCGSA